jgi:hypothetical protein
MPRDHRGKSVLTAAGVRQSVEHARRVNALYFAYELARKASLSCSERRAAYPIYSVFALSTDLQTDAEQEWRRFEEAHAQYAASTSDIFGVCVVGTGTAFWHGEAAGLTLRDTQHASADFAEVVAFICFVADYSRKIQQKKISDLPLLAYAHYLLP